VSGPPPAVARTRVGADYQWNSGGAYPCRRRLPVDRRRRGPPRGL